MYRFLCFLGAAAALLLYGCAGGPASPPSSPYDYSHDAVRIGVTPDYPPVLFKEFGHLCGIEVDLAELVVDDLNAPVELHEMAFRDLIPSLERGEIDVIMSGLSITPERARQVRFVTPYMTMGQMALVRAGDADAYADVTALQNADVHVGVLAGSTSEQYAQQSMEGAYKSFVTADATLDALKDGTIDVIIADALYVMLAAQQDESLAPLPWLLTREQLAWAVSRDPSANVLFEELNTAVRSAKRRGDVDRIVDEYVDLIVDAE